MLVPRTKSIYQLGLLALLLITEAIVCSHQNAWSQLIPDDTLGTEKSIVTPIDSINDRIDGGAIRNTNLFHSFLEFNIDQGRGVDFTNPAGIENILTRVTGNNPSQILGRLGVLGNANLFLINPNGIFFGEGASLDISGSFLATTANSIKFDEQGFYSASNPEAPTLLTVNPSAFFFNQLSAQSIEVRSNAPTGQTDVFGDPVFGLQVPDDRSLILVGGEILIDGGRLNAFGGRVELAGMTDLGIIELNVNENNLNLSLPTASLLADILLRNNAVITASGQTGGDIEVWGNNLILSEGSRMFADTLGNGTGGSLTLTTLESVQLIGISSERFDPSGLFTVSRSTGNAGDLNISTKRFIVRDGAQVGVGTFAQGNGGTLTVNASELVQVTGESAEGNFFSNLFAISAGTGNAGQLIINTGNLLVEDGAAISATTFAEGNGGSLTINASNSVQLIGVSRFGPFPSGLFVQADPIAAFGSGGNGGELTINTKQLIVRDGANIGVSTFGDGNAGDLTVNASESVELIGTSADGFVLSGLFAQTRSSGNAGTLTINTPRLLIRDGALAAASTRGQGSGNGGSLIVKSELVELIGTSADGIFASTLSTQTEGTGNAGELMIQTEQLIVQDGANIGTGSFGEGNGGDLTVIASDYVQLNGVDPQNPQSSSGLFSQTEDTGSAGDLTIQTPFLQVQNQAEVSASTFGGESGDIIVSANKVEIVNGGKLRTTTFASEDAGDINLFVHDRITLTGSDTGLFANTEVSSTGDGGNIFIDPKTVTIQDGATISVESKGSGIGGNIELFADFLTLDNQATISAETTSNTGGNITLQIANLLLLRRGSKISTTAGTAETGGDGGNMILNANFIIAEPFENSDITANASEGNGGNIEITTQGIFGIEFREQLTSLSDITASSQFGIDGLVQINRPEVDPSQRLVKVPINVVDPSSLIAQGCSSDREQENSEFFLTGRGGLPPNPREVIRGETSGLADLGQPIPTANIRQEIKQNEVRNDNKDNKGNQPIIEAKGLIKNHQGKVMLVANSPVISYYDNNRLGQSNCPVR